MSEFEQHPAFRNHAESEPRDALSRRVRNIAAGETDGSCPAVEQADQRSEERRFSCTIGAQKRDALLFCDREIQIIDDLKIAVECIQA